MNIESFFDGKKVLITGGTGSLGQALTKKLLKTNVEQIRIFSRNEFKQIDMESKIQDKRLRFFIGDVRDLGRLVLALEDIDFVFHAAALKHVPKVEYNPFEAVKTNVMGSQNVIDACIEKNIEKAVCIGTDKAVSPLNTYGATKLLMEKLFITANNYLNPETHKTKFIAVRYGNVLGSSGSVVPKFIEQIKSNQKISITDTKMTRFSLTMEEALNFILNATIMGKGSEIFVPKIKSYSIMDVKQALIELLNDTGQEITGIRTGEKIFETLINSDEIRYSWEIEGMYMILNPLLDEREIIKSYPKAKQVEKLSSYSSEKVEKFSKNEIKKIIEEEFLKINKN
ncbi:polysaccharide biosynthesis protein [Nitrosopumilus sp.]|uniref:polysaccharide biosynthesis protein n=1 Tax=Nitrosopumilus sp. TaxID=2024843 RepID=UPI003D0F34D1